VTTEAMTVQNVIGGLVALALVVYLFVALIRPERF
jgi:K+-transporting ATPase KdpF subunit